MKRDRRFKTEVPEIDGWYYARFHGTKDIHPVRLDINGRGSFVWTDGDEEHRYVTEFDWFGPVRPVVEQLR